jgi:aldehyde:ferredoxin oxidoreductase
MYLERILVVDLTQRRSWVEVMEASQLQLYLGGVGLGARLLYDRLPRGADPLGAENVRCSRQSVAGTPSHRQQAWS